MLDKHPRVCFEGLQVIDQAYWACHNASFVFDNPVTVFENEQLELKDGQYYLIRWINGKEEAEMLSGKWTLQ